MACQAVRRIVVIPVALNAEAHPELVHQVHAVHLGDISMASSAVEAGPNVCLVIKEDEVGQVVDPSPGHRPAIIIIARQRRDLWMIHNDAAVTEHASFNRRHACVSTFDRPAMTHQATDLLVGNVDAMAEGDWLHRAKLRRKVIVIAQHHHRCQQHHRQRDPTRQPPVRRRKRTRKTAVIRRRGMCGHVLFTFTFILS